MKKHIPNIITSLNLLCGCLSVISVFQFGLIEASLFIFIAALLDFLDGFAARLLNASSLIGKQLDSLADLISFGLAPGLIVFKLFDLAESESNTSIIVEYLPYIALLIPVFSALRLAKFNIDEEQQLSFKGLPTPANAIFIASLPLAFINLKEKFQFIEILTNPVFLIIMVLTLSFLLVSNLPMISLKFKNLKWKENKSRFIFLIIALSLLLIIPLAALPLIIFIYILISVIDNIL